MRDLGTCICDLVSGKFNREFVSSQVGRGTPNSSRRVLVQYLLSPSICKESLMLHEECLFNFIHDWQFLSTYDYCNILSFLKK